MFSRVQFKVYRQLHHSEHRVGESIHRIDVEEVSMIIMMSPPQGNLYVGTPYQ